MLYKSSYTEPENFRKIFNFKRRFNKGTFDQIRKNYTPNY